nr:MAG TPA: collagen triple helix repeat protein [Caudoviricetes sp.]
MPNATTINIPENININIGIPGQKGTNGSKGEKGDPFRYEDFTPDQLQALKGEKGDKGEPGIKGEDGKPGKAFTYEDFTPDQLAQLKGEKGDPGESGEDGKPGKAFTYEDFTPDQLATLKGEKGETGDRGEKGDMPTISNTVHFLKENFIYLKDDNLDTVLLTALKEVNRSTNFILSYEDIQYQYPFTVDTFNDGDENIKVHGYNHFKVQIANEEPVEILNNIAILPVPKNTGDFINVKYINFLGEVVTSKNVEKVKEDDTPAVVYQENNPNMKLSVKGTKAVLEFISNGRNSFSSSTLRPLKNKVKRLIIDLANIDKINGYLSLPFVPEKIEIINYKTNNLNLSFQGDYYGMVKVVSEKAILNHSLNSNGEYEVSNLNGKSLMFSDSYIYINDAL